jgi:hypothetical protein
MPSSSTARFQKTLTCPAAEALARYTRGDLAGAGRAAVALHVAGCDFCGAETQLLSRFAAPPAPAAAPAPLPVHLRQLAEDLLAQPSFNRARFAESLLEIERLTLTDA